MVNVPVVGPMVLFVRSAPTTTRTCGVTSSLEDALTVNVNVDRSKELL